MATQCRKEQTNKNSHTTTSPIASEDFHFALAKLIKENEL